MGYDIPLKVLKNIVEILYSFASNITKSDFNIMNMYFLVVKISWKK